MVESGVSVDVGPTPTQSAPDSNTATPGIDKALGVKTAEFKVDAATVPTPGPEKTTGIDLSPGSDGAALKIPSQLAGQLEEKLAEGNPEATLEDLADGKLGRTEPDPQVSPKKAEATGTDTPTSTLDDHTTATDEKPSENQASDTEPKVDLLNEKDPYKILGVPKDADAATIKSAYKKLAREHHPDVGGNPEIFDIVAKANEFLSDPEKRREYDQQSEQVPPATNKVDQQADTTSHESNNQDDSTQHSYNAWEEYYADFLGRNPNRQPFAPDYAPSAASHTGPDTTQGINPQAPDTNTNPNNGNAGTDTVQMQPDGTQNSTDNDSSEPTEKTPEERLKEATDRLEKLHIEITADRKKLLDEALSDPAKMENLESIIEMTEAKVEDVMALVQNKLSPEALAKISNKEFSSLVDLLKEAESGLDPQSQKAKELHWMIKLLLALGIAIALPAMATAATAGKVMESTGNAMKK